MTNNIPSLGVIRNEWYFQNFKSFLFEPATGFNG